ncbi:MAG: 4Fe-4S binding protein [Treponema sp.]|nr:4Fe-4S binding protein [Treponema sp.]
MVKRHESKPQPDGKCIQECPLKVIVQSKNATAISKCIACGICAKVCPQGILYIKSDEAA